MLRPGSQLLIALLLALFVGGRSQPVHGQAFLDVVVQDRFFAGSRSCPSLKIRTRQEALVDGLVYDAQGNLTAFVPSSAPSRQHQLVLTNLPPVARGIYAFCLAAHDPKGPRLGTYPELPGGGEELKADDCRWNLEKQQIEYLLPKAGFVRIRAGLADGAYLQQVLPWEAQLAGRHVVPWTNTASDIAVRELGTRPEFQVKVLALALPVNLLVDQEQQRARPPLVASSGSVPLPAALADLSRLPWPSLFVDTKSKSRITIADDYRLALRVEEEPGQTVVNFRVDCADADRSRLLNQRFEIMLSLDGIFLSEDEQAILPFNHRMSTRGLTSGQHLFTVNVLDAEGVPGTASAVFTVTSKTRGSK